MITPSERKIAVDLKEALIRASVPVHSVIVFGSRARGEARADSDFDVLVVVERLRANTREKIWHCAWVVGFEAEVLIQPIVKQRRRIESGAERESLLMLEVRAHGVAV